MLNKVRDLLFPTRLENRKNGAGLCFSQLATNNIAKYLNNDHPHTWRSPELHEFLQTYSESVPAPRKPATPKKPKEPPAFLDLHETFAQWYDRCGNRLFVGDMEDHAYAFLLHARNLEDENPLSLLAHFPRDLDTYSITLTVNEKHQILHYTLNPDPNQPNEEPKPQNEENPETPKNTNDTQNHNSLCTTGVSPVPPRQAYPLIAPPAPNPHNPENPIAPLQSVGQSPTPPTDNTTTPKFPKLDSLPNVIDFISL